MLFGEAGVVGVIEGIEERDEKGLEERVGSYGVVQGKFYAVRRG